jgi:nicotinamidase-related amidase
MAAEMNPKNTCVVLIGYQNDYFASDGILTKVIEESSRVTGTLQNTFDLINRLKATPVTLVSTPIVFTPNYSELAEPIGILKTIKEVGAFKKGTKGAETISQLKELGTRVVEVPGKKGLNAFSNTELDKLMKDKEIQNVVLAGAVTSICIDSTGRAASERGFNVTVLSDCTSSRTNHEQAFYCSNVFPLYATVMTSKELLEKLHVAKA